MRREFHGVTAKAIIENSPSSTFHDNGQDDVTEKALEVLNRNRASQKKFAIELRVHPSQTSMWLNRTRPLEGGDAKRILAVAELLALEDARASTALAYEIRCYLTGRKP